MQPHARYVLCCRDFTGECEFIAMSDSPLEAKQRLIAHLRAAHRTLFAQLSRNQQLMLLRKAGALLAAQA